MGHCSFESVRMAIYYVGVKEQESKLGCDDTNASIADGGLKVNYNKLCHGYLFVGDLD